MKRMLLLLFAAAACTPMPKMVNIPAGNGLEAFRMSATEITNAQYEAFDPQHQRDEFSAGDKDAVNRVSWSEAMHFCEWLSRQTGKYYRLPTEAEWEYACRAGTTMPYTTGETFPKEQWKEQANNRDKVPVSLRVAQFKPNAWGLYDMHGNVEEWCLDSVDDLLRTDPPATDAFGFHTAGAQFKAVRGGSHNTPVEFLRSDARAASIPTDKSVLLGFRVVQVPSHTLPSYTETSRGGILKGAGWASVEVTPPLKGPVFMEPQPFIKAPVDGSPFYSHNHQPAVAWLPDGRLLAIWYSTDAEAGREMVVLQSIFQNGSWQPASLFCKVPSRNMTGSALLTLDNGEVIHFQGIGDAGEWKDLALAIRRLVNGSSWTPLEYIGSQHTVRHQVIAGPLITRNHSIILCCDAGPDGEAGTALYVSHDGGNTWQGTGGLVKGIHAGIIERADGSLYALGRGNAIDGRMPCSISHDGGYTWEYSASPFPPIGSGQRLVLKRLQEGPVMLCSFGEQGLFVALSYDDGVTWPKQKLLTDGKRRTLDGGAWTGSFEMDATHAEPKGYLACTQSPDGLIHLLSSRVHYRFNLAWIEAK